MRGGPPCRPSLRCAARCPTARASQSQPRCWASNSTVPTTSTASPPACAPTASICCRPTTRSRGWRSPSGTCSAAGAASPCGPCSAPSATTKTAYASQLFGDSAADTYAKGRHVRAQGFRAAKFGWGPYGSGTVAEDRDQVQRAAREGSSPRSGRRPARGRRLGVGGGVGGGGALSAGAGGEWRRLAGGTVRRRRGVGVPRAERTLWRGADRRRRRAATTSIDRRVQLIDHGAASATSRSTPGASAASLPHDASRCSRARAAFVNHTFTNPPCAQRLLAALRRQPCGCALRSPGRAERAPAQAMTRDRVAIARAMAWSRRRKAQDLGLGDRRRGALAPLPPGHRDRGGRAQCSLARQRGTEHAAQVGSSRARAKSARICATRRAAPP